MADDLGYADLSCYGRREYQTPVLDGLAAQGMMFMQAYANSAVCTATRVALITGRYQYRLQVGLQEPLGQQDIGLPSAAEHRRSLSLMRDAGYRTTLVGKWHLGALPKYGPLKSGYDEFWGLYGGGVDYYRHGFNGNVDLWDGETKADQAGYMTDLIADRTIPTLERRARTSGRSSSACTSPRRTGRGKATTPRARPNPTASPPRRTRPRSCTTTAGRWRPTPG